jgi:hypothetical protein
VVTGLLVSIGLGFGFILFFGPAAYLGGNLYVGVLQGSRCSPSGAG